MRVRVRASPGYPTPDQVRVSVSAEEGGFFADSEEGAASAAARAQWEAMLSLNPNPKPNTTPTLTLP